MNKLGFALGVVPASVALVACSGSDDAGSGESAQSAESATVAPDSVARRVAGAAHVEEPINE